MRWCVKIKNAQENYFYLTSSILKIKRPSCSYLKTMHAYSVFEIRHALMKKSSMKSGYNYERALA